MDLQGRLLWVEQLSSEQAQHVASAGTECVGVAVGRTGSLRGAVASAFCFGGGEQIPACLPLLS